MNRLIGPVAGVYLKYRILSSGNGITMVDTTQIVNELLCFVQNRRDSLSSVVLAKIASDFYESDYVAESSKFFFEVIQSGSRFVKRRDGAKPRGMLLMDDLLQEWHAAERSGVDIPTFTAKNLSRIPPIPSDAVDFASLLHEINDLRAFRSHFVALKADFDALRDAVTSLDTVSVRKEVGELRRRLLTCSGSSSDVPVTGFHSPSPSCGELRRLRHSYVEAVKPNMAPLLSGGAVLSAPSDDCAPPAILHAPTATQQVPALLDEPTVSSGVSLTDEGWKVQTSKKNRRKRKGVLTGTAQGNEFLSGLSSRRETRSAGSQVSLFVGRCDPRTTSEGICGHISGRNVSVINCEPLNTPVWYTSFCVTVNSQDRDTLLIPEAWPAGVIVRPFYKTTKSSLRERRGFRQSSVIMDSASTSLVQALF